jgi:hypothetical protein
MAHIPNKWTCLRSKVWFASFPLEMPNTQYYFCETRDCDESISPSTRKRQSSVAETCSCALVPKEESDLIPVCYCFGFTPKDIEGEIGETGRSTVADRITAEVTAGRCACEVKNPSGKCCLGNVTRVTQDRLRNRSVGATKVAG